MIQKAKGEYIVFIDDDDMVSERYVELILKAIKKKPDCVGIHLNHYLNNKFCGESFHSLQYNRWWDELDPKNPKNYLSYTYPYHLNPVKRELALKAGFPDLRISEDVQYSRDLLPFLETEEYIIPAIYSYQKTPKE